MDRTAAARGANVCFRFNLWSVVELRRCCILRQQLATTINLLFKRLNFLVMTEGEARKRQMARSPSLILIFSNSLGSFPLS